MDVWTNRDVAIGGGDFAAQVNGCAYRWAVRVDGPAPAGLTGDGLASRLDSFMETAERGLGFVHVIGCETGGDAEADREVCFFIEWLADLEMIRAAYPGGWNPLDAPAAPRRLERLSQADAGERLAA